MVVSESSKRKHKGREKHTRQLRTSKNPSIVFVLNPLKVHADVVTSRHVRHSSHDNWRPMSLLAILYDSMQTGLVFATLSLERVLFSVLYSFSVSIDGRGRKLAYYYYYKVVSSGYIGTVNG